MRSLIIYVSKTGATERCAKKLKEQLKDCTMGNVNNLNEDINQYDLIIIGSPIRIGMIDKRIKKFLLNNREKLKAKKTAYFICCGFHENWKKYYEENIPKDLLESAVVYDSFGGELDIEKQKGFDKWIIKMVSKSIDENKKIEILDKNIDKFIKELNQ